MKRVCVSLCAVLAVSGAMVASFAAAPVKVSDALNIENLAGEAKGTAGDLKEPTATAESLASAREDKSLDRLAGTLACLAQAITEHEKGKATGINGPALRDAALAMRKAKTVEAAQAALAGINSALEGKQSAAEAVAEHPWNKLINMHRMMEEFENRNAKLSRSLARPRRLAQDSKHADVLATIGLAMIADTHEVKNPADLPKWDEWSRGYVAAIVKVGEAMRAGNADEAAAHLKAASQQCEDCHKKFRD
jgi:hypothetical protein